MNVFSPNAIVDVRRLRRHEMIFLKFNISETTKASKATVVALPQVELPFDCIRLWIRFELLIGTDKFE